jgi:hypothetical protein
MQLPDVNVLVCAYREDAVDHEKHHEWLRRTIDSDETFGLTELALSGFLRIVTHPGIYTPPSPIRDALSFVEDLRGLPNCAIVRPAARHWEIFARLCAEAGVRGNLVPDAFHAALAMESGSEWITMDRGYARFPGLRWRTPF